MADGSCKILVTIGKDKFTIEHYEGMTFADVRARVVSLSGQEGISFRFLCKGKAVNDDEGVCNGSPPSVIRIMALKTKQGHQDAGASTKRGSSSVHLSSALQAAKEKEEKKASISKVQTVKPSQPKGDTISEDESFVMVRVRGERYHVRIDLSKNIFDLKSRLESMEGILASAQNMNLIFAGKQRKNDEVLHDIGAKRGSMFMLLFLARHHDMVGARADLVKIKERFINLESRAKQVELQFNRRLMDNVEYRARLGEIEGEAEVLKNQLSSNKCQDNFRKSVIDCQSNVESAISSARGKLS